MSFTVGDIRFIDSLAFLNESLEQLVQNLYDKDNADKYIHVNYMKRFMERIWI